MNMNSCYMRVAIDPAKKFPNGTYIFTAKGIQLNPNQGEGKTIAGILEQQKETRKENDTQTRRWESITGIDINNDGEIG